MKIPLTIHWAQSPQRPAVAWWVAGVGPDEWIERLVSWNIPLDGIELFVLSSDDGSSPGVLAALGSNARHAACRNATKGLLSHAHRGIAYGLIGDRLFVPIDAALSVLLSDEELAALLPSDSATYIWQSSGQLVAFDRDNILHVSDFLQPPGEQNMNWSLAQPGVQNPTPRLSIEAEHASALTLLGFGRDDIGSTSIDPNELAPSPLENKPGAGNAIGRALGKAAARMSLWFASQLPATANRSTWVNAMEGWAREKLQQFAASLYAQRHRELARLLNLLEHDPDEGLRYALPLGGDEARGIAPLGGVLGRRDVNFRLRYPGSGPVDTWNIGVDFQAQLQARYRDLARREIALGRHRRAAYIYAELLGDWSSAANTLRDGGHHREAAVVYRERLGRIGEAAKCLEAGGLYIEAIECYAELNEHEKVGDLYTLLERVDDARGAFAAAVARRRGESNFSDAARIAEMKLQDPDEALALLAAAWPGSGQAAICVDQRFRVLGRLERHESARQYLGELATNWPKMISVPELLSTVAREYPDARVRALATDQSRILVAALLTDSSDVGESDRLTKILTKLVPGDLLLARDCRRFVEAKRRMPQPRPTRPNVAGITRVREFQLPAGDCRTVCNYDNYWIAAVTHGRELILTRGNWHGHIETAPSWKIAAQHANQPVLLAAPQGKAKGIIVHVVGAPPLAGHRRFAATDAIPEAWHGRSSNGIDANTIAVAYNTGGELYCARRTNQDQIEVGILNVTEKLLCTKIITLAPNGLVAENLAAAPPFAVRQNVTFIAIGNKIFMIDAHIRILKGTAGVTSVLVSRQHTRDRLIVTYEDGGTIFWSALHHGPQERFAHDMHRPLVGFTQSGLLVVLSGSAIEVYRAQDGRLKLRNETSWSGVEPIAVLPTNVPEEFAVFEGSGRVQIFRVT